MDTFIRWANRSLGVEIVGLFMYNMWHVLATGVAPRLTGAVWAAILTLLLLQGGLIQLGRFNYGLFQHRGQVWMSLGLLVIGMVVDLGVWGAAIFGYAVPHSFPLFVIAGYWVTYYGEIVVTNLISLYQPGGLMRPLEVGRGSFCASAETRADRTAGAARNMAGQTADPQAVPDVWEVDPSADGRKAKAMV